MTRPSQADAPLDGEPPAPERMRDPSPRGGHPNTSFHPDDKPGFDDRPGKYPAAAKGLGDPGGSERKSK